MISRLTPFSPYSDSLPIFENDWVYTITPFPEKECDLPLCQRKVEKFSIGDYSISQDVMLKFPGENSQNSIPRNPLFSHHTHLFIIELSTVIKPYLSQILDELRLFAASKSGSNAPYYIGLVLYHNQIILPQITKKSIGISFYPDPDFSPITIPQEAIYFQISNPTHYQYFLTFLKLIEQIPIQPVNLIPMNTILLTFSQFLHSLRNPAYYIFSQTPLPTEKEQSATAKVYFDNQIDCYFYSFLGPINGLNTFLKTVNGKFFPYGSAECQLMMHDIIKRMESPRVRMVRIAIFNSSSLSYKDISGQGIFNEDTFVMTSLGVGDSISVRFSTDGKKMVKTPPTIEVLVRYVDRLASCYYRVMFSGEENLGFPSLVCNLVNWSNNKSFSFADIRSNIAYKVMRNLQYLTVGQHPVEAFNNCSPMCITFMRPNSQWIPFTSVFNEPILVAFGYHHYYMVSPPGIDLSSVDLDSIVKGIDPDAFLTIVQTDKLSECSWMYNYLSTAS